MVVAASRSWTGTPRRLSIAVSIALELHGIRKRFTAGAGACRASADILRGVDLSVRVGECVVVVGGAGSGKSTLLLCAAGLIAPDSGERSWFGDSSRAVAARRVLYHHSTADLMRTGGGGEAHLHLIDLPHGAAMGAWIEQRCEDGDAVIVAGRDDAPARGLAARVLALRGGQLHLLSSARARVAERVPQ
jgi:ABC-type iron transport system FetAB ATPase subunit